MRLFVIGFSILLALAIYSKAHAKDVSLAWDASPSDGVAGYKLCHTTLVPCV